MYQREEFIFISFLILKYSSTVVLNRRMNKKLSFQSKISVLVEFYSRKTSNLRDLKRIWMYLGRMNIIRAFRNWNIYLNASLKLQIWKIIYMNSSLLYKFYISFNQNDSRWLQSIDKLNHKITRSLVLSEGPS